MLLRLAASAQRRPVAMLIVAAVVLGAAGFVGRDAPAKLQVAGYSDPGSQSAHALDRLRTSLGYSPEPGMIVLASSTRYARSASVRRSVAQLAATISRDPLVGRVFTAFAPAPDSNLISRDGRRTLLLVHFRSSDEAKIRDSIDRIRGHVHAPGLTLRYTGFDTGYRDVFAIARKDLVRAEIIAFPLLALLLIFAFRGLVAAMLPLVIGGISVVGTFFSLRLLSGAVDVSIFALNVTTALGLGLAVDYGLLLVSRYREELAVSGPGPQALARTLTTAGRAVAFSGLTVAGACAALLVFPQQFIYSLGAGGAFAAAFSALAALMVIPPLLALLGNRVNALNLRRPQPPPRSGRWYRFAQAVMRRPVPVALASAGVLIAAGLPFAGVNWTFLDTSVVPRHVETRTVANIIDGSFPKRNLGFPVNVAVSQPRVKEPTAALQQARRRVARASDERADAAIARLRGEVQEQTALAAAATPAAAASVELAGRRQLAAGIRRIRLDTARRRRTATLLAEQRVRTAAARERAAAGQRLRARLAALDGAEAVGPIRPASRSLALVQVLPIAGPLSRRSQDLVKRVRAFPEHVVVGGRTAEFIDLKQSLRDRLPLALGLLTLITLVVLFAMTGSVVLPVKAVIMNLVTVSATMGLLVLIFQKHLLGLQHLVAYDGPRAVETTLSVVMIAVAVGLATDYAVLLLSRIQEEHLAGRPNEEAIALGLERTARVITSAALLLAVAYLCFATSRIFLVKEATVGQALAVLIDASIVRALLVPSLMRIMGDLNWWAPRSLTRLRERVRARLSPRWPPIRSGDERWRLG